MKALTELLAKYRDAQSNPFNGMIYRELAEQLERAIEAHREELEGLCDKMLTNSRERGPGHAAGLYEAVRILTDFLKGEKP